MPRTYQIPATSASTLRRPPPRGEAGVVTVELSTVTDDFVDGTPGRERAARSDPSRCRRAARDRDRTNGMKPGRRRRPRAREAFQGRPEAPVERATHARVHHDWYGPGDGRCRRLTLVASGNQKRAEEPRGQKREKENDGRPARRPQPCGRGARRSAFGRDRPRAPCRSAAPSPAGGILFYVFDKPLIPLLPPRTVEPSPRSRRRPTSPRRFARIPSSGPA